MKKIKCDLSLDGVRSVQHAINEVELYTKDFIAKVNIFVRRLGAVGIATVQSRSSGKNFDTSFILDDISAGHVSGTLLVSGEELLFFEFGTGITHNSRPSSHPKGAEMGYTIGGYVNEKGEQKGYGNLPHWRYRDDNGQWQETDGWKAEMPVYHAYVEMVIEFRRIANEVFMV